MENKEFVLEALERITPNTEWNGKYAEDKKALENLDILEDMLECLLYKLFYCSDDIKEWFNDNFYADIAKKKRKIINDLKNNFFGCGTRENSDLIKEIL